MRNQLMILNQTASGTEEQETVRELKRNMKKAYVLKLLGPIASTLIAGSALQAQTPPSPPSTDLPSVEILATDPTALGGTSSGAFTLIQTESSTTDLAVSLAISGTASNGVDYELLTNGVVLNTNVVTLPAGFLAVDILVQPLSKTVNGENKTVVLGVVTNASYQVLPGARRATVAIIDDVFNIPPPSVAITAPTNGSVFWFGTPITLTAEATDAGADIRSVSLYANDDLLAKLTNSPYSLVWTNARPGPYTLTALAFDVANQSTLSAPVKIFVTNSVPVVELLSPTNGSNFTAHQDITLLATASDASNSIVNVTFYANGRVLDVATNSPYTFTWTNVSAGFYLLQASATDTSRTKVYSNRAQISVSRP
jgi:hypothetical protein